MTTSSGRTENSFQQTMLGLSYTRHDDHEADLFSRACAEQFLDCDFARFGYLFAQVFEANVVTEIALLAGLPHEELDELRHRPTPEVARLADLVAQAADLSVVELVNVAAALISVSRFSLASSVLAQATRRTTTAREMFEVAMLQFIVANRIDDLAGSSSAFLEMRRAIESAQLPPDRVLDAATQAVVWFMKRKELPESEFVWYLDAGRRIAAGSAADPASVSSWYRALAMVPAAKGHATLTRRYMEMAHDAAAATTERRPRAYESHLVKTYYESTVKEHMYVTKDFDKAEAAGHALIALDPVWAPSHGELAEAYLRFGRVREAAVAYDAAVALGPPYYGHHLVRAAEAHAASGNNERALELHLELSRFEPGNPTMLVRGLDVARQVSPSAVRHFEDLLSVARPS